MNRSSTSNNLKERQARVIEILRHVLSQPPFDSKKSSGIADIKAVLTRYEGISNDALLTTIVDMAKSKSRGMAGAFDHLKARKGVGEAAKQFARGAKEMVGKVDQDVKALYDLLAKLDPQDPYELEGEKINIGKFEYDISNVTDISPDNIDNKRSNAAVQIDNHPRLIKRHSSFFLQPDANREKTNHQFFQYLENQSTRATKYDESDHGKILMKEMSGLIREVGNDYRSGSSPDEETANKIKWMFEDYRVYRNKNESPVGVVAAFKPVDDLIAKKVEDWTPSELNRAYRHLAQIFNDYQTVESTPGNRYNK